MHPQVWRQQQNLFSVLLKDMKIARVKAPWFNLMKPPGVDKVLLYRLVVNAQEKETQFCLKTIQKSLRKLGCLWVPKFLSKTKNQQHHSLAQYVSKSLFVSRLVWVCFLWVLCVCILSSYALTGGSNPSLLVVILRSIHAVQLSQGPEPGPPVVEEVIIHIRTAGGTFHGAQALG